GGGASPEEAEEAAGATKASWGQEAEEMKLEPLQERKPAPEENLTWSSSGGDEKVLPSIPPRCHSSSSPVCPRRKPRPRPQPRARSRCLPGLSAPPPPPARPPLPPPPPPPPAPRPRAWRGSRRRARPGILAV
ncbi:Ubiquitin carboxyl-terminal hydrolase 51, partial [Saguinus oedipus]